MPLIRSFLEEPHGPNESQRQQCASRTGEAARRWGHSIAHRCRAARHRRHPEHPARQDRLPVLELHLADLAICSRHGRGWRACLVRPGRDETAPSPQSAPKLTQARALPPASEAALDKPVVKFGPNTKASPKDGRGYLKTPDREGAVRRLRTGQLHRCGRPRVVLNKHQVNHPAPGPPGHAGSELLAPERPSGLGRLLGAGPDPDLGSFAFGSVAECRCRRSRCLRRAPTKAGAVVPIVVRNHVE
jgi:hypothetical protein